MKWQIQLLVITILVSLPGFALAACQPRPAPTPAPDVARTSPQVTPVPATAPTISREEASWAEVVAAARKEGKVTLYQISFAGDVGPVMARAFDARYGIKVEFVTAVGAVLIERLKSEKAAKKYIADVLNTSTTLVAIAKEDGLTEAVGYLPSLQEKDVWLGPPLQDPQGHVIGFGTSLYTVYVNTRLVGPGDEPKSYKELLQPRWKGKLGISDPNTVPLINSLYSTMLAYKLLDDSFFVQLAKQDLKLAATVREGEAMVSRGDVHVAVPAASIGINPLIKQGAPVKPVDIEEGAIRVVTPPVAVVKDAPHPNAARVFTNWLLGPEGQAVYSEARSVQPLRKDVPDFTPPAGRSVHKKELLADVKMEGESTRVQREKILAKLMGLAK